VRHAVGLPLNSNVRQHVQAPWCASISIQMQRVAAIGLIQSVASCFWHSQRSWPRQTQVLVATQRSCPSAFASPVTYSPTVKTMDGHSIGGSRLAKLEPRLWGHVCALLGNSTQGCRSRNHFLAFSGWSLGAAGAGRSSGPVRCKFGGSTLCVSRTVGRCNQEMRCSLTLRSSGAPTACRQAWAMGARTFSMAQACRHAVGAPLSSNVRQDQITNSHASCSSPRNQCWLACIAR
jgi:hypothetical protein